jgi:hypothetical protein
MLDLVAILADLAKKRPIFHSEADFQHALAWELHEKDPDADVRLEFPVSLPGSGGTIHVDLWIRSEPCCIAIELKYMTRKLNISCGAESYVLASHGAHNRRSYDAVKDIERLEGLVLSGSCAAGYACVLTNDSQYWKGRRFADQADDTQAGPFRLTNGRELKGPLKSAMHKPRNVDIELRGTYTLDWRDYSGTEGQNDLFRYMIVQVVR